MSASKVLLCFCLSFVVGIFISSLTSISQLIMLGLLILALILISVLWKYKEAVIFGFCVLFFLAGIFRYQAADLRAANDELKQLNDSGRKTILIGIVSKEPDIRDKSIKLTFEAQQLQIDGGQFREISGQLLINAGRYPEYKYGDKLKITGKLKSPSEDISGFNYKNYLKKDGIYSMIDFPEIEVVGQGFGNLFMAGLISFKDKFEKSAAKFISPPQLGLLEGLIFGDEGNISKEWQDKFNITGTRHITAVSGMNITIISALLLGFLLNLGLWRKHAFYASVVLLFFYILMVGASASAVRAGIMAGIFMLSQYLGRMSLAARAVAFAAFLMLAFNPFLLMLDVGFQLSFLAILGLIYFQPFFSELFRKVPNFHFLPLRTALAATISAQVFTLPVLIYDFGRISLVSPLANVLIVPFLSPLTILMFAFGLAGMFFSPLGAVLSWPVWISLTYIISAIDWLSKIPLSSLAVSNVHWAWLAIFYLALWFLALRLQEQDRLKFLGPR